MVQDCTMDITRIVRCLIIDSSRICTEDVNREDAGHPRLVRLDNVDEVLDHFHQNPRTSTHAAVAAAIWEFEMILQFGEY